MKFIRPKGVPSEDGRRLGRSPASKSQSPYFNSSYHAEIGDEWHRILTGRQSPEPVSAKLKSIYGQVLSEQLPPEMVELLGQLDSEKLST